MKTELDYKTALLETIDFGIQIIQKYLDQLGDEFKGNFHKKSIDEKSLELTSRLNIVFTTFSLIKDLKDYMTDRQRKFINEVEPFILDLRNHLMKCKNTKTI